MRAIGLRLALTVASLTFVVSDGSFSSAAELSLNALADNDSTYYEYYSEGFVRMDQFASSNPMNQNFHNINDPSVEYGQGYDGFA